MKLVILLVVVVALFGQSEAWRNFRGRHKSSKTANLNGIGIELADLVAYYNPYGLCLTFGNINVTGDYFSLTISTAPSDVFVPLTFNVFANTTKTCFDVQFEHGLDFFNLRRFNLTVIATASDVEVANNTKVVTIDFAELHKLGRLRNKILSRFWNDHHETGPIPPGSGVRKSGGQNRPFNFRPNGPGFLPFIHEHWHGKKDDSPVVNETIAQLINLGPLDVSSVPVENRTADNQAFSEYLTRLVTGEEIFAGDFPGFPIKNGRHLPVKKVEVVTTAPTTAAPTTAAPTTAATVPAVAQPAAPAKTSASHHL